MTKINLSADAALRGVLALAARTQNETVGTPAYFPLAEATVRDVASLASTVPPVGYAVDIRYLQFAVALGPFKNALATGDFGRAHDWIHNALGDPAEEGVKRMLATERATDFLESRRRWIRDDRPGALADFATDLYYYCRVHGAMAEAARTLAQPLLHAIDTLPSEDHRTIAALGMMQNCQSTTTTPWRHR